MKNRIWLVLCLFFTSIVVPATVFGFTETKSYILITEDDIARLSAGKIQTVLNMVPGVNAGDSSISIRGINRVKVVLDGKIINDPTSSHGGVKWESVSLQAIESIKVYKNSGGAAFGNNASGGAIVINTREQNETSGFVQSYFGNFDTFHTYLSCQSRVDKFSLSAATGYDKTDGFKPNSDKEKTLIQGDLSFSPDDETRFSVFASKISEDRGSSGLNAYPTPEARYSYDLFTGLFTADVWGFTNRLSYTDARKNNINPVKNLDKVLCIEKIREELTRQVPWDLLNIQGDLVLGGGFEKATATSTGFSARDEINEWGFATLSTQLDSMPVDLPVQISLGLRFENFSGFDGYFSPEFTAGIQKNGWRARINLSRTHNIPSFYQRYFQSSSMLPNPDLTPEQADNMSLSLSWEIFSNITLDLSPFYNRITDRITYIRNGPTGSYVNLGKVTYKGLDISCDMKLWKDLKLKTTYTYLEAKDDNTGLFITSKSKHRALANLVYNPANPFCLRLSVKYVSKVFSNKANTKEIDGYTTGSMRMEYQKKIFRMGEPVTFFVEVKNITDKFYLYADGYSAPPRTWITGVQVKF